MRVTTYILIGLLIGLISFTVIIKHQTDKCREAMIVMKGLNVCVDTPGCFFDADDITDANRAFEYHNRACKKPPA